MKTSEALMVALVAAGTFSGTAWGNTFSWSVNTLGSPGPGSVNYSGGASWVSGTGGAQSPLFSKVSSDTKAGGCPGCVINFTLPITYDSVTQTWDVTGGTFTISTTGLLTVGASTFTGILLTGTVDAFTIDRFGTHYLFDSDPTVSVTSFATGLLAAFGLPSGLATGVLDLQWKHSPAQLGSSFQGAITAGSLDLSVAPEPATWLLLGSGLILFGVLSRVKRMRT